MSPSINLVSNWIIVGIDVLRSSEHNIAVSGLSSNEVDSPGNTQEYNSSDTEVVANGKGSVGVGQVFGGVTEVVVADHGETS